MSNSYSPSCDIFVPVFNKKLGTNWKFNTKSHYFINRMMAKIMENEDSALGQKITEKLNAKGYSNWRDRVNAFNEKYQTFETNNKDKEDINLEDEDRKFLNTFADACMASIIEQKTSKETEYELCALSTTEAASLYTTFRDTVPAAYRQEVMDNVVMCFIYWLDSHVNNGDAINHEDALHKFGMVTMVEDTRLNLLDKIAEKYTPEAIEANPALQEQKEIAEYILNDKSTWSACVYMAKGLLFDAEKIRLGKAIDFVQDFEGEGTADTDDNNLQKDNKRSEETSREKWMEKADTVSSFKSMTKEMRSFLYKLTPDEEGGLFGVGSLGDIMDMHKKLQDLCYGKACLDSDDFMQVIKESSEGWMQAIVDLVEDDEALPLEQQTHIKSLLFTTYYHNQQRYNYLDTDASGNVYVNDNSESSSTVLRKYKAEIYNIEPGNNECIFDYDGSVLKNRKAQFRKELIIKQQGQYYDYAGKNPDFTEKFYSMAESGKRDLLCKINNALNLHMTKDDMDRIQNDEALFKTVIKEATELIAQITADQSMTDITAILTSSHKIVKRGLAKFLKNIHKTKSEYLNQSPVESSIRFEGSTYMSAVTPYFVGDHMLRLKHAASRGKEFLNEYIKKYYFIDSTFAEVERDASGEIINVVRVKNGWLKMIWDSTQADLDDPSSSFNRFISEVTRALGEKGKEWVNFIEGDNYRFSFKEFCNELENFDSREENKEKVKMPLFVTGDSNSSRYLTVDRKNLEVDDFVQIALDELDKMAEAVVMQEKLGIDVGLKFNSTTGEYQFKFSYFPALNNVTFNVNGTNYSLSQLVTAVANGLNIIDVEAALKGHVATALNDGFRNFKEQLQNEGLIKVEGVKDDNERKANNVWFKKDFFNSLPKELKDKYNNTTEDNKKEHINYLLWNWYTNNKYHTIQQLQFFTADPMFYKSTNDAQKRYKQVIASGKRFDTAVRFENERKGADDPRFDKDGKYVNETVMYFNDVKHNTIYNEDGSDTVFKQCLDANKFTEEQLAPYGKKGEKGSSLTDGQAYRSFDSYRRLMLQSGGTRWTGAHEKIYKKVKEIRAINKDSSLTPEVKASRILQLKKEIFQLQEEGEVVFQPLKLHYYGFERVKITKDDGSTMEKLIPVQHKYSEFPVIPELLPQGGAELRRMAELMESKGVDLIASTECVKVGRFGAFDMQKDLMDNDNAFNNGMVHVLSLEGLREQNNVPEHNDTARARGTQFIKHGYMGLSMFEPRPVDKIEFLKYLKSKSGNGQLKLTAKTFINLDNDINGKDMMQIWNALGSAGFIKSFRSLARELGDSARVSQLLTALSEIDPNTPKDQVLAYQLNEDGDFNIPLSELSGAFDNFASIISKLRKEVIKQRFKGGSFVQASALGYEKDLKIHYEDADGNELFEQADGTLVTANGNSAKPVNITYVDCARPFDFSYTGINGEKVELDYFEYVDPETGRLIDEDGNVVDDNNIKNSKLEKRYPGMTELIAYRIPTEKAYSTINMRAIRFFPKVMGGIIMVPTQYTTIAGFDFDIDKLYYIAKEFEMQDVDAKIGNKSMGDIWNEYYKSPEGSKIFDYLGIARENAIKAIHNKISELNAQINAIERHEHFTDAWYNTRMQTLNDQLQKLINDRDEFEEKVRNGEESGEKITAFETQYEKDFNKLEKLIDSLQLKLTAQKERNEDDGEVKLKIRDLKKTILSLQEELRGSKLYHRVTHWEEGYRLMYEDYQNDPKKNIEDLKNFPKTSSQAFERFIRKQMTEDSDSAKKFRDDYFKEGTQVIWKSEYNPNIPVLKNSQSATNNMMFEFMRQRLTDQGTFKERFTPGGFYNFKKAKGLMMAIRYGDLKGNNVHTLAELEAYAKENGFNQSYTPNYDITEPETLAHYQTWNALYDKLIGMSANQSINQRLSSLFKKWELATPLRWGSMLSAEDSETGKDIAKIRLNNHDSELITTEMLAASVDAVKDALLEFFGLDDKNFSIACLMAKIGATPTDIGLLLNQPIIREACKIAKQSNGRKSLIAAMEEAFKNKFEVYPKDVAISGASGSLLIKFQSNTHGERDKYLTSDALVSSLSATTKESQLAVYAMMQALTTEAQTLSNVIKSTKSTSTNTISSDVGGLLYLIMNTDTTVDKLEHLNPAEGDPTIDVGGTHGSQVIDPSLMIEGDGDAALQACVDSPCAMEQIAFSCIRTLVEGPLSRYFPYTTKPYKTVYKAIGGLTNNGYLTADMINDVVKDIPQYLIGKVLPEFNEYIEAKKIELYLPDDEGNLKSGTIKDLPAFTNMEIASQKDFYTFLFPQYYANILAHNAADVKAGKDVIDYSQIPILQAIVPTTQRYSSSIVELTIPSIGSYNKTQKTILRDSWVNMLKSGDPVLKNLAHHLFYFSFFQAGLTFSPKSLSSMMSAELKLEDEFAEYREFFNLMFNMEVKDNNLIIYTEGKKDSTGATEDNSSSIVIPLKELIQNYVINHYSQYYQLGRDWFTDDASAAISAQIKNGEASFTISPAEFNEDQKDPYNKLYSVCQKLPDGKVLYKYIPAIVFKGELYICDNGIDNPVFNESVNPIVYKKVQRPTSYRDYSKPSFVSQNLSIAGMPREIQQAMLRLIKDKQKLVERTKKQYSTEDGDNHIGDGQGTASNLPSGYSDALAALNSYYDNELNDLINSLYGDEIILSTIAKSYKAGLDALRDLTDQKSKDITIVTETIKIINNLNKLLESADPAKISDIKLCIQQLKEKLTELQKNVPCKTYRVENTPEDTIEDANNPDKITTRKTATTMASIFSTMQALVTKGNQGIGRDTIEIDKEFKVTRDTIVTQLIKDLFPERAQSNIHYNYNDGGHLPEKVRQQMGNEFDARGRASFDDMVQVDRNGNLNDEQEIMLESGFTALKESLNDQFGVGNWWAIGQEFSMASYISHTNSEGHTILSTVTGRPDLIIVANNTIYIIDFKTGSAKNFSLLPQEVKLSYYTQLEVYKQMIEAYIPEHLKSKIKVETKVLYAQLDSAQFPTDVEYDTSSEDGTIAVVKGNTRCTLAEQTQGTSTLNNRFFKFDGVANNGRVLLDEPNKAIKNQVRKEWAEKNVSFVPIESFGEKIKNEMERIEKSLNLCN